MTTSPGHAAAHLARLVEGRSARRLAPRISTTSVDANAGGTELLLAYTQIPFLRDGQGLVH
jgi:hypothetical protein